MVEPQDGCLTLSAYVTAQAVSQYFSSPQARKKSIRRLRQVGIRKAYVEFYRSGLLLEESTLIEVKDDLERAGLRISGGIATTHGEGFTDKSTGGPYWICLSSDKSLENLELAIRRGAKVFDEIIVDDFLCTACKCRHCKRAKGGRDWSALYRDLLVDFVTNGMIAPAREENPHVKLIIKYPQWYDRFHVFGYDVLRMSKAFDTVWVGTEIRDPRVDYVHQYQPFSNYMYLCSIAGEKVKGAWFDHLWCYPEIYLEQAYQSVLAGSRELVLFSYWPEKYDIQNPNTSALIKKRKILERICSELVGKKHVGIEAYKPAGSDPRYESYIFDYLGVLGFPVLVTASRPSTEAIILPVHSLKDPGIEDFLIGLEAGRTVLATSGFVEGLRKNSKIMDLFGLSEDPVCRKETFTYRFSVEGKECLAEERVLLRSYLRPTQARVLAEALGGRHLPILTVNQLNNTTFLTACLDTYRYMPYHGDASVTTAEPVSLVHLPQAYLNLLRNSVLPSLGVAFKAPARVGLYLYSSEGSDKLSPIVVENFGDQDAFVELKGPDNLESLLDNAEVKRTAKRYRIRLPRRDIELLSDTS